MRRGIFGSDQNGAGSIAECELHYPIPLESAQTRREPTMSETTQYAVFLFPQALEALGAVIAPYLTNVDAVGTHTLCSEVDASGPFFTFTVQRRNAERNELQRALTLP